jgi:hypothetical protein
MKYTIRSKERSTEWADKNSDNGRQLSRHGRKLGNVEILEELEAGESLPYVTPQCAQTAVSCNVRGA